MCICGVCVRVRARSLAFVKMNNRNAKYKRMYIRQTGTVIARNHASVPLGCKSWNNYLTSSLAKEDDRKI